MEYLIKASAILTIFYVFYKLLLQKETFFQSNRIYLILGIVASVILPLIIIPVYIEEITVVPNEFLIVSSTPNIVTDEQSFDYVQLFMWIYTTGVLFFISKFLFSLVSLCHLLITKPKQKIGEYYFINDLKNSSPFSFFKYIVYNETKFSDLERHQIIIHEKAHANQWHSFDVLLAHITQAVFWFNPIVWFYKKDIEQNLEFIADAISEKESPCAKGYQQLLLKTTVNKQQLLLTNNFYNSLIKKRIIMLHKNRSKNINQIKFTLIIPVLLVFVFSFNTKTIAQTKVVEETVETKPTPESNELTEVEETIEVNSSGATEEIVIEEIVEVNPSVDVEKVIDVKENIEAVIITKNTEDFSNIEKILAKNGVTLKVKNIKRNNSKEITAIKIEASSASTSANFNANNSEGIAPIKIVVSEDGKQISIGNSVEIQHNSFVYETKDGNKFVIDTDSDHDVEEIIDIKGDGDNVYIIKKDGGDHEEVHEIKIGGDHKKVWVSKEGNKTVEVISEDGEDKSIFISEFSDEKPLIVVDGEISDIKIEDLEPDSIESMNVIKGKPATEKYGEKGEHGVIEITTKK